MQEHFSIIVEIPPPFFLVPQQICLNHCSPRPSSRGKGILYSKRDFNLSIYPKSNSLNMKNDQYIPHEVSMRSNSQVINLIEAEGAAGYGFYWALLEYLRAQNHYTGDIRAIKNIARQMKIRIDKAIRVLNDYGLFVVENTLFSSQFLNERMVSFDRQRARCEAYKRKKDAGLTSLVTMFVSSTRFLRSTLTHRCSRRWVTHFM